MIPLERVAPDARPLIAAFRENGAASFGGADVDEARAGYERSCAANGLSDTGVDTVDHEVPVADGVIRVRQYRASAVGAGQTAVMLIHGGGWALGGLDTHDAICRRLALRTGRTVFAVDYRLAPEHRFPLPLLDCVDALAFVRDNAERLDVDATAIALVGDSAGGTLVAALANNPALAVDGMRVAAQVLLYPATDLAAESDSYDRIDEGVPLTGSSMRWFRSLYLSSPEDALDPRASPLRLEQPVADPPPAFIVTVGIDPLCDEGIAYAGYLARHGGRVEHHHLPAHTHGIFTSAGKVATGEAYLERAASFITEATAKTDVVAPFTTEHRTMPNGLTT